MLARSVSVPRPVQHRTFELLGRNYGVVYLHGRCCTLSDERAVGTVAGPPAQGGIQILGGVPLFQEQIVEVVLTVAVCWVDRWD